MLDQLLLGQMSTIGEDRLAPAQGLMPRRDSKRGSHDDHVSTPHLKRGAFFVACRALPLHNRPAGAADRQSAIIVG
jgi:hypothetical protein